MPEEKTETEMSRIGNVVLALAFWGLVSLAIATFILFFVEQSGIPLPATHILLPLFLVLAGLVLTLGVCTKSGRNIAEVFFFFLVFWD